MGWDIVIGLEIHVELATKSKIFCACSAAFGGEPNTQCCPICAGMPGTLPVLNEKVLEYAVKAGLALDCHIPNRNQFDRKNYVYPDLPKAYQTSQLFLPFALDGSVTITLEDGSEKTIGIREIHMEEDAGKLVHGAYGDETLLDYNRGCVPLIEIVSNPDMTDAYEVLAYLEHVKKTLEYLEVSDCQMQEGSMRADVNLSVRPTGTTEYGTRTEMKNLNSFRAISRAIAYEAQRQIELLEAGGEVLQETRRWDDNKCESFAMRSKENAQDYRYFPDPDIPPIVLEDSYIEQLRNSMPEFSKARAKRFVEEFSLAEKDASILTNSKHTAVLFEEAAKQAKTPKEVATWMLGDMMYHMSNRGISEKEIQIQPVALKELADAVTDGKINRQAGKKVFEYIFDGGTDVAGYIEKEGLAQVNDDGLIVETIEKILAENEKAVLEYRDGKEKAFGFLVGQVMRELKGKGNPTSINQILKEKLG